MRALPQTREGELTRCKQELPVILNLVLVGVYPDHLFDLNSQVQIDSL